MYQAPRQWCVLVIAVPYCIYCNKISIIFKTILGLVVSPKIILQIAIVLMRFKKAWGLLVSLRIIPDIILTILICGKTHIVLGLLVSLACFVGGKR